MSSETITLEYDGPVAIMSNNRPEKHNAANNEMDDRLWEVLGELNAREGLRAVVWRGNGKSFSSGRDLTELGGRPGGISDLEFIERGHPVEGCVISCGGGLVVPDGMPDLLHSKGVVVCLWATPEAIYSRTKDNPNRPLLNVPDPLRRIRELLAERKSRYLAAGNLVSTTARPLGQVADAVLRLYQSDA